MPKKANIATFNEITTKKDGQTIDQTITTFFKAPKSFTGEDMVEIGLHGGPAIIKKILEMLSEKKGVKLASAWRVYKKGF